MRIYWESFCMGVRAKYSERLRAAVSTSSYEPCVTAQKNKYLYLYGTSGCLFSGVDAEVSRKYELCPCYPLTPSTLGICLFGKSKNIFTQLQSWA